MTNPDEDIEYDDTLGPAFSIKDLQGEGFWERPESSAEMLRIFRALRDHEAYVYKSVLEQTNRRNAVSIDGSSDLASVQVSWDNQLPRSLGFNSGLGVIGPALHIVERYLVAGRRARGVRQVAMLQIAGMETTEAELGNLPRDSYINAWKSRTSGKFYLTTRFVCYMTKRALDTYSTFDTDLLDQDVEWHSIPSQVWLIVMKEIVKRTEI